MSFPLSLYVSVSLSLSISLSLSLSIYLSLSPPPPPPLSLSLSPHHTHTHTQTHSTFNLHTYIHTSLHCTYFLSYNGGRTADDIIKFVNDKANTRGGVKKEPSHVVELNPSNFDKIVMDTTKHVLVEFYAPCELLSCNEALKCTTICTYSTLLWQLNCMYISTTISCT